MKGGHCPVPARLAQPVPKWGWRDEAAADQSMRPHVGDPGRIVHVALAPGDIADVHRVGEYQRDVCFEHVADRPPVDARGLHRNVRTTRAPRATRRSASSNCSTGGSSLQLSQAGTACDGQAASRTP
jgi:hypothetical protein